MIKEELEENWYGKENLKNHNNTISKMREFVKELSNNPEKAKAFFVRAGILNQDGSLSDNYK